MSEQQPENLNPVWCVIANVRQFTRHGHGGAEIQKGIRVFSGGTRVYCYRFRYLYESALVIGRHRKSKRYISIGTFTRHLTNWRVKMVYSPAVLKRLAYWDDTEESKELAERIVAIMTERDRESSHLYDMLNGQEPSLSRSGPQDNAPGLGHAARLDYYLRYLIDGESRNLRNKVASLLLDYDDPRIMPVLIYGMQHDSVNHVRYACAQALTKIGTPEALTAVEAWRNSQQEP